MIVEWTNANRSKLVDLFDSFKVGRRIIFPALFQNRGIIWVDSIESPKVARLQMSIINALAGDSTKSESEEIIKMINPHELVFFSNSGWSDKIHDIWGDRIGIQKRTMMSPETLNNDHLKHLVTNLPEEFTLEQLDLETTRSLDENMSMHISLFFGSPEEFIDNGFGFCIKHAGEVVSMASTFTPFIDEFEIEVRTEKSGEYRQKGLATIVSSALILHAFERGFVPHWDAANEISVKLALKLGYSDPYPWEAFYLKKPEDP
ncbi:MAG: GNAT family N-acetyltransferase [Candidatus Thorarchaeota archaeon]|nr:MAG: GNAT family N-acetyltransferase [Candidatus Thorarchaeota archaeon]